MWMVIFTKDDEDRIAAVKAYAEAHPYTPPQGRDHIKHYGVVIGTLRCIFTHTIMPDGGPMSRMLSMSLADARDEDDLPSPEMVSIVARLFGFVGRMTVDYVAAPHRCECAKPCPPNIVCAQALT